MKRSLILTLALTLLGCAGGPEWSQDGVSQSATAQALADCQSEATQATRRDTNIMTDIMATRGGDWQRSGMMGNKMDIFAAENNSETADIVNRCMISKGFVPGR